MRVAFQDSAQRTDSAVAAATSAPPRMGPPQNVGYLQAVFVEAVLLFGGYWLLLHRRTKKIRDRQAKSVR